MALTLDDLIQPCEICSGSGKRPEERSAAGGHTFGRQVLSGLSDNDCDACKGTGRYKLTSTGVALLKLHEILRIQGRV
jgi:hypothetical protein